MIRVTEENDEYWVCYGYLHDNSDELPRAEGTVELDYNANVLIANALYEVRIDFRVRKSDGEIIYDWVS